MSASRDEKTEKWTAQCYYENWKGEKKHKKKRGFATKKEVLEWEREFLKSTSANVPFIHNSKRGLDTRVSLKDALSEQGFKGSTRGMTEWNEAEKQERHLGREQVQSVVERSKALEQAERTKKRPKHTFEMS